jgi:tetraacyldisaccharide 4'-kinase
MRAGIENWLLKHWYGSGQPPWYLRMLEPLYRFGYQRAQRTGSVIYRPALPLIVVGNITAGGSGKTPLVIRLCQLAMEMGLKPGIASTGYGRQSLETIVVQAGSDAKSCGDEPVLLAQRTGVPVVVAADRLDAVEKLVKMGLDLVISDDGLQRADLAWDIELCVVDGARGLGNGHLLPAGPLRESADRLGEVDYVLANGEWAGKPDGIDVSLMHLHASVVCSIDGTKECTLDEFSHQTAAMPLHAFAAIGNPERFFRMLERLGFSPESHRFPDHHMFERADFDSISTESAIIMTEKDAVKCRALGLKNAWYVPVETYLPTEFEQTFKDHVARVSRP